MHLGLWEFLLTAKSHPDTLTSGKQIPGAQSGESGSVDEKDKFFISMDS
jgi:hypothetical protein